MIELRTGVDEIGGHAPVLHIVIRSTVIVGLQVLREHGLKAKIPNDTRAGADLKRLIRNSGLAPTGGFC